MVNKNINRFKMSRIMDYLLKRGISKSEAQKITLEYLDTGLDFPDELILHKKALK